MRKELEELFEEEDMSMVVEPLRHATRAFGIALISLTDYVRDPSNTTRRVFVEACVTVGDEVAGFMKEVE